MLEDYIASLSHIRKLPLEKERALWKEYKEQQNMEARQELIEQYQLLVFREAVKYPLQETVVLDLIQEGTVGLMEAADRYDPSQGVAFSLYAVHRIRGRMMDFLRENQQEVLMGDPFSGQPLAVAVDVAGESAFDRADRHMMQHAVTEAMDRLPAREKNVLQSVYLEEQTAAETADRLSVSASYVRQLEKKGIRRLRGMLSRMIHDRK